jgi:RNA polymerase sigma factor (sigma-70 family)
MFKYFQINPKFIPVKIFDSNNNNISDYHLWQRFKKGDIEAFEIIYKKYFKQLGSYALGLCADKNLVEDAIHDLFVELWRRKESLGDVENVKFYLFKAARNQFSRSLKHDIFEDSEDIDNFLDYLSILSSEQESIYLETEQEKNRNIKNALRNLSPRQSEVIHLRFYQGLSLDEITSIMEIPKQAVKNMLSKSYAVLRISLKHLVSISLLTNTLFP